MKNHEEVVRACVRRVCVCVWLIVERERFVHANGSDGKRVLTLAKGCILLYIHAQPPYVHIYVCMYVCFYCVPHEFTHTETPIEEKKNNAHGYVRVHNVRVCLFACVLVWCCVE